MNAVRAAVAMCAASICLAAGSGADAHDASLSGRWNGTVAVNGRTEHVSVDFGGTPVHGSLDVPRERVLGKPLHALAYDGERVAFAFDVTAGRITFAGRREGDVITGTVTSGAHRIPLTLRRAGRVPVPPYSSHDVRFANGSVVLSGTLLVPPGRARRPAVILIHGSSTPSRNDLRFYADLFARHGIAALIYDKRDVGGDLGGASRVDVRELAGDAAAGIRLLERRADVDPRRIGVWGLSQGGWVAPIVAAGSADVAFVVSFSGPGVSYAVLNTYADGARLRGLGFSEADVRAAARAEERVYAYVRHGGDRAALQLFLDDAHAAPWARHTTLPRFVPTPREIATWLEWRNLDLDPADYWRRVRAPVLAVFGADDDVVPVAPSAARMCAAFAAGGNRDAEVRVFANAGHLIETPAFLAFMTGWMERHAARAGGEPVKSSPPAPVAGSSARCGGR